MMFAMLFRIVLYAPILGVGGVLKVLETESSMTWILAVAVGLILVLVLVLMIIAMPKFNKLQTLIDRLNLNRNSCYSCIFQRKARRRTF